MPWFRPVRGRPRTNPPRLPVSRFRPQLEVLEGRETPAVSSISSSFNAVPILATSRVWFNSVMEVSNLGTSPVTVFVRNATVSSSRFNVAVPDAVVTFSTAFTSASTTFDAATARWVTNVPVSYQGSVFLAGATLTPGLLGLPGGINPVTWQGDFTTDTPGVQVNWSWSAAVYSRFSNNYHALGVKPIDGAAMNPYPNADLAGTPESYRAWTLAGGTGNGLGNRTGTRSSASVVEPSPEEPDYSSLSGFVFLDENDDGIRQEGEMGIQGAEITLEGVDYRGLPVYRTATTDASGYYHFAELLAGTYSLHEWQPPGYDDGLDSVGTQGGSLEDDMIYGIALGAGVDGLFNNFGERRGMS